MKYISTVIVLCNVFGALQILLGFLLFIGAKNALDSQLAVTVLSNSFLLFVLAAILIGIKQIAFPETKSEDAPKPRKKSLLSED